MIFEGGGVKTWGRGRVAVIMLKKNGLRFICSLKITHNGLESFSHLAGKHNLSHLG